MTGRGTLRRIGDRLPSFIGSIRFRLTVIYSFLLFGLAALVLAGTYVGLEHELQRRPVQSGDIQLITTRTDDLDRDMIAIASANAGEVQRWSDARTLSILRRISLAVLPVLFLASLLVGWFVAGRVLAPIGRITSVARDIQATDLSRRIRLPGPADELRELADTFDGMLERLDEAFQGQQRFIHEASHELRNPLAVIRTNVDVALADPEPDLESLTGVIEIVQRSTGRISRLVDDLLAYADRGAPVHEHVPVDIAALVTATAEEFRTSAQVRDLDLVADVEPGLWVLGDAVALRQVVANLLANAIRLAPAGTEVGVGGGRDGDWAWFAIDDAGPGIAEQDRDQVFTRFWRGEPDRARAEGHSGLGLTIVKQIAEAHRGHVRVRSSERGGSTFVVWLPAVDSRGGAPPHRPGGRSRLNSDFEIAP